MKNVNLLNLIFFISVSSLTLSACTNSGLRPADFDKLASTTPSGTATTTGPTLKVTLAQAAAANAASSGAPNFSLYFDNSAGEISNYCSSNAASGKACVCRFTWTEVNSAGGSATDIIHNVRTPISAVQPNLVACPAPTIYANEIGENTQIKISVEPHADNSNSFATNLYSFTKQTNNPVAGNFQDSLGRAFLDIYRYTCYELNTIASSVGNAVGQPITPPDGANGVRIPIFSTQLCASDSGNAQCTAPAGNIFSANSFYRNLFIRSTDIGGINSESALYKCPIVTESLRGNQPTYYPLDSSFSLALNKSQEYPIGVEAFSKIAIAGDPNSAGSGGCSPSAGSQSSSSTGPLVKSCLGWALRPNGDGTCPTVQTTSGTLPTFRLRRFTTIYPVRFSAKGDMIKQPQSVDTVYILDRPVKYFANYDPTNPKTMLGPKPCPMAILDHKNVTSTAAAPACLNQTGGTYIRYYSTNATDWNGKNVDGIMFPNSDLASPQQNNSANTNFAVLSADQTQFYVKSNQTATVKNYLRPVSAWAPHFDEDFDFRACAPLASQVVDPPIQLARANANSPYTSWCAKVYPNFNPVASTSTTAETGGCNSTRPTTTWPITVNTFIGNSKTRSAATSSSNWKNFPLTAFEADIHSAINPSTGDSSFKCQITKPSSTSATYPSDGCCKSTTNATNYFVGTTAQSKHFEPSTSVQTCVVPYE